MSRKPPLVAAAVLALVLAARGTASFDDRYEPLLALTMYARGERAAALAGLAQISEKEQIRKFELTRSLAMAAQRCQSCPAKDQFLRLPLKAAVMLHLDKDFEEHPRSDAAEQLRPCRGRQAWLAGRYATLLAPWPETRAFARDFFLAVALRNQIDACLEQAEDWGEEALKLFRGDSLLLFGLGGIHEEAAALLTTASVPPENIRAAPQRAQPNSGPQIPNLMVGTSSLLLPRVGREQHLKQARRLFADAVAADGRFALARVRLGRVLWRLGEAEDARAALEAASTQTADPATLYLARLFLGRVHEDAGGLDAARREYAGALELFPESQAAAVSLAHALRLAGDAVGSRQALAEALAFAGKRRGRDVFWDYLSSHVVDPDTIFDRLRRESLQ